ncbi:MAG: UPF0175 family protein [Anaerolineales bacterium]
MNTMIWNIPPEAAFALKVSDEEIGDVLRMASAAKLYEIGKLSSGAAAALAGVPRVVFLARLADYGVNTFDLTQIDLEQRARLSE